eukprot:3294749-Rhodomonas_salina.3
MPTMTVPDIGVGSGYQKVQYIICNVRTRHWGRLIPESATGTRKLRGSPSDRQPALSGLNLHCTPCARSVPDIAHRTRVQYRTLNTVS